MVNTSSFHIQRQPEHRRRQIQLNTELKIYRTCISFIRRNIIYTYNLYSGINNDGSAGRLHGLSSRSARIARQCHLERSASQTRENRAHRRRRYVVAAHSHFHVYTPEKKTTRGYKVQYI